MADVLKRLEEIEQRWSVSMATVGLRGSPAADVSYLLRLTRALLESQGELMERVGNQECRCPSIRGYCRRCEVLDRAEKVRKREV